MPSDTDHTRERPFLEPVLTPAQRRKYGILVAVWLLLAGWFWLWWFDPAHNIDTLRYGLVTLAIGWVFFLQVYFIAMFLGARRSSADAGDLPEYRVAMVTTKTPSEPFRVVRRTLEAMLAQDYPHDTWLADEDPSEETRRWCAAHDVRISTRKDRPDYHRKEWPRRTRCKEGNLAFFYDQYGYDQYDIVSQLDADHVPEPGYLRAMLKPFEDPKVGYVSAPSVCDNNASRSWAARTRLHAEAMFHGVLQSGYAGRGWAPMCIGSHYTVRTKALKEVGGLGPELAEDHSTSLILNAGGWRGVHAIDASARGAGPENFSDMITQEFQWSRSLLTLLLRYTPRYYRALPPRLKFQFVFSQLWYPLFALFMALTYAFPIWAVVFDVRFADVTYPEFFGHAIPPTIALIFLAYKVRADGLLRPRDVPVISWEKALFPLAQWPWVFWGCTMAIHDRLTNRFVDFRITPKGDTGVQMLPFKVIAPYFALALGSGLAVLLFGDIQQAKGFYLLALVNAVLYSILMIVIITHHVRANPRVWRIMPMRFGVQVTAAASLVLVTTSAAAIRGAEGLHAINTGFQLVEVAQTQTVVSGAGQQAGALRYTLDPHFNPPGWLGVARD